MEESPKKRQRKSKLVPRNFKDACIDDEKSKSLQEAKLTTTLLPTTKNHYTKEMDGQSVEEPKMKSPVQFSVNIEVEECDSDLMMDDGEEAVLVIDESESSYSDFPQFNEPGTSNEGKHLMQFVTSEDEIREEVEHLSKITTSIADKQLEIEIANMWGKSLWPVAEGLHETKIQGAISSWRIWYLLSKIRETILSYKCYVCDLGWWSLTAFRDHIVEHNNIKVVIETLHHECNIVAFSGNEHRMKDLQIEGNCWRCLKNSDTHTIQRNGATYYTCEVCHDRFFTCSSLIEHEGVCQSYSKMFFKDKVCFESKWKCNICHVNYLSEARYNAHLTSRHAVRSDEPIAISLFKSCIACFAKYTQYNLHVCPKKVNTVQCRFCCRKFQSKQLLSLHEMFTESNISCRICMMPLKKQCMEMEHMLKHTKNYMKVLKCILCTELILFPNEDSLRKHLVIWHGKRDKRAKFDMMIVPKSVMMKSNVEQLDIVASVHGKFVASNRSEDLPIDEKKKPPLPTKVHKVILDDTQEVSIKTLEEDDIENIEAENRLIENQLAAQLLRIKEEKREDALEPVDEEDEIVEVEYVEPEIIEIKDDDYEEYDNKTDVYDASLKIKKEDDYLDALTKVFQGSKSITGTLVTSDHIKQELIVKEEPEEYYEDDMIILNYDFDIDRVKNEESNDIKMEVDTSNADTNSTKATDQKSEVKIDPEIILLDGLHRIYRKRKTYKCNKCEFEGIHKVYKEHVKNSCPPRHHLSQKFKNLKPDPSKRIAWDVFKCTKCDTTFESIQSYTQHFALHGLTANSCPQCFTIFDMQSKLVSHLIVHVRQLFVKIQLIKVARCISSRLNGVYQCSKCRRTVRFKDFFIHWEAHLEFKREEDSVDSNQKEILEGEIGIDTSLRPEKLKEVLEALQRRLDGTRRMGEMKSCVVCSRKCNRRSDFKRHLIEHLLLDAFAKKPTHKALRCQICYEKFSKAEWYKSHMRDHGSLAVYRCELCNKGFSDSSNFAKHKKVHNLEALVCDICLKKFSAKVSLERHMMFHMTNSPVKCDQCGHVVFTKSLLKKHIKNRHEKDLRKFMCNICRMRFGSLKEKWDHMWDVHKERTTNADCPICNRSYRKFQDLKRHMKDEHRKTITMKAVHMKMFNSVLQKIKQKKQSPSFDDVEEFLRGSVVMDL